MKQQDSKAVKTVNDKKKRKKSHRNGEKIKEEIPIKKDTKPIFVNMSDIKKEKNGNFLENMSYKTEKSTNSRQSLNSKSDENIRKNPNESIDSKRSDIDCQTIVNTYLAEVIIMLNLNEKFVNFF